MWTALGPLAIAVALTIGAVLFLRRYGGAAALEQLERANRILARRVTELERENSALHAEIAALRSRTDVAAAFEPVRHVLEQQHAEAMGSFDRMAGLLGMVAERLGPETNGE